MPPSMAARSSAGTPANCDSISSLAAAERALGVRIVGAPHDRRQAGDVAGGDRDGIVLERDVELALHVLARLERVRPLLVDVEHARHLRLVVRGPALVPVAEPPVGVLADAGDPALVHPADERHEPVRVELDQAEVELGIPLRHAAGDQLDDDLLRVDRVHRRPASHPLGREPASIGRLSSSAMARTCFSAIDSASPTFTPPVAQWKNTCAPIAPRRRPHRLELGRPVRKRRVRGQQDARGSPRPATRSISATASLMSVSGIGAVGRDAAEVRRVPLDDVVVVDACVCDRQLVVVAVEREERAVRVHQLGVDAVEIHVLEHALRVARMRRPVVMAVARHRPAFEAGRANASELAHAAGHERVDLEVLLPEAPVAQVLRQAGPEEVGGLDDVAVGRDDEVLSRRSCGLSDVRPTGRYKKAQGAAVAQAVAAATAGIHLGRLGRRRRARSHQPAHSREGAGGCARSAGRHQLLPQPAARLSRAAPR